MSRGRSESVLARCAATFHPELSSAGRARRLLEGALGAADRMVWADAGALALSEVVTNAALHAHTDIEVLIEVFEERLRVEVHDGNPALPRPRGYGEQATTGRGMDLVAALTDSCGVYSLGHRGKVVWFCLTGRAEASAEDLLADWDVDGDWDRIEFSAPTTVTIRLPSMPVALWLAARQHHDAILRELVLYLAEHPDVDVDLAQTDRARGLVSRAVVAAVEAAQQAGSDLPEGRSTEPPAVPETLTLEVEMPPDIGPAYQALQQTLDVAEQLATGGKLLVHPGLPEIVAVRQWACQQVLAQLAEREPVPWPGTAQVRFETVVHAVEDNEPPWDDALVRDSERGVVAGDDANRIVAISRPLAALLGWQVEELVGRRVLTLIPPRLREAHVAGFSRHMTTGEARILGMQLVLPVLAADGSELSCRFMVERAPSRGGRSVFLAWIEPEAAP